MKWVRYFEERHFTMKEVFGCSFKMSDNPCLHLSEKLSNYLREKLFEFIHDEVQDVKLTG